MYSINLDSKPARTFEKKLNMRGVDNNRIIHIIEGAIMKKLLMLLIFAASITFAVKPVPRATDESKTDKPVVTIQEQKDGDQNVEGDVKNVMTKNDNNEKDKDKDKDKNKDKTQIKNKPPVNKDDKIVDIDSNNVNDQRENDLLKIKQLKSKFQDLFKKKPADDNDESDERKKPSKPATPPKKKTR
jgi:hypothetical protein